MNGHDAPPDLQEVESLILSLYEPNPPEVIAQNQALLSRVQATPAAWSIARGLLGRPDEKVKFIGVVTIIVKLNTESAALSTENAEELLTQLLGWYAQSLDTESPGIVARKLSSALSTFFVHFHATWPQILRQVTRGLSTHLSYSQDRRIAHISNIRATTWVLTSILEECAKIDLNAPTNLSLYQSVLSNIEDATELIAESLAGEDVPEPLLDDSIRCLQAWVSFYIRASVRGSGELEPLRLLMNRVIDRLSLENAGEATLELLSEVLNSYPVLLTDSQSGTLLSMLVSPQSQKRFQAILNGEDDFELVSFGNLLLGFADVNHERLLQDASTNGQLLLSMVRDLLSSKGCPVVEDRLFVPAIEFWSTFAETLADETLSEDDEASQPWARQALNHVISAVSHAWQKIVYPPQNEVAAWDSNERVSFQEARNDVVDLLQATYALVGPKVVITFSELALEAIDSCSWMRAEAALFCLAGLSDCARDDTRCDDTLATVFASSLFSMIQNNGSEVTPRLRQVSVSLIEKYTDYFERNTTHLPAALQLLFSVVGEQTISASAAKSIQRLCSSCRHHLHSEVEAFLTMYSRVVSGRGLDCMASERIIGAIASVAQAMEDHNYRDEICSRLLDIVKDDTDRASALLKSADAVPLPCDGSPRCFAEAEESAPMHVVMRALKSLSNIGKGFKALADGPVDVDQAAGPEPIPGIGSYANQKRILSMLIEIPSVVGMSPATTELTCHVLRCGFAETSPGPFVFAAEDVVSFLTQHDVTAPGVGHFVSTGCSFLNSLTKGQVERNQPSMIAILQWVVVLLSKLEAPETETELTQNGIEFVARIIHKTPATLLAGISPELIEFFFVFTLKVLVGKEPLPKAAAADFWTTFVGLRSEQHDVQESAATMMRTLGPMLSQALARNIGGQASRSELAKLSEPVKKLVSCYPQSKNWLETAFEDPEASGPNVTREDRSLFVKKLISLRGAKATNQVIRDFWLSARGTSFAYTS
ncbi:hypothetical protein LIA77_09572 [Sarocladium implicatum]|nr:hypothetical protein LIA77_09572 [Sarocladium implicatum]